MGCLMALSHYLSQCWPRSMSPNGNTRPQCIKENYSRVHVLELPRWEVNIALGNVLVLVGINIICIIHFSIVLLHAITEVELSATIYVSFPAVIPCTRCPVICAQTDSNFLLPSVTWIDHKGFYQNTNVEHGSVFVLSRNIFPWKVIYGCLLWTFCGKLTLL